MTESIYKKTILFLGFSGLLFSGYLSAVKLFTSACALNEPCPYFLGYPACWYGFLMFLALFVSAVVGFSKNSRLKTMAQIHMLVSGLGILFAGRFTIPEIGRILSGHATYSLGLPTCAYGLIFYVIIFILSIRYCFFNPNIKNGK